MSGCQQQRSREQRADGQHTGLELAEFEYTLLT